MKTDNQESVAIDISLRVHSNCHGLPSRYLTDVRGEIRRNEVHIGTVSARIAMFSRACEDGVRWLDILHHVGEPAFLPLVDRRFSAWSYYLESQFLDFSPNRDLMILDGLEIYEAYRNRGYGLHAMSVLFRSFVSTVSVVACKFYEVSAVSAPNPPKDQLNLTKYFSLVGFRRVPRHNIYTLLPHLNHQPLDALLNAYFRQKQKNRLRMLANNRGHVI